jgi:hypothetical protein
MEEPQDLMRKMLAENAKAAAAVVAGAQQGRDDAAVARIAAHKTLLETTQKIEALSAGFYRKHYARIKKDHQEQLNRRFAAVLLEHELTPGEVLALLDLPEAQVIEISRRFGYTAWEKEEFEAQKPEAMHHKIGDSYARVTFKDEGRGGTATFQLDQTVCRFWYELAGSNALLLIDAPAAEKWEAHTGIPLALREKVLHFIGERAVADNAPGYRYRIEPTTIVIY